MPRKDGTGPDGKGPKKNNQGVPAQKRDGSGSGRRGKRGGGGGKRGGKR